MLKYFYLSILSKTNVFFSGFWCCVLHYNHSSVVPYCSILFHRKLKKNYIYAYILYQIPRVHSCSSGFNFLHNILYQIFRYHWVSLGINFNILYYIKYAGMIQYGAEHKPSNLFHKLAAYQLPLRVNVNHSAIL